MMTAAPTSFSDLTIALCFVSILLVPLAGAGIALINTGLVRSRSAAHSLVASLCVMGTAGAVYILCGFSWEGFSGLPAHGIMVGGKVWDLIATQPSLFVHPPLDVSPAALAAWLQMSGVGVAALIPLGTGAERWRLGAICAAAALMGGVLFPLFGHSVWGGGWLSQLGVNYRMGAGFIDVGGSSTIHAVGGLTALAIAWMLGPRRGKFEPGGMPAAIPGHNTVLALFGCFLAWIGFTGLNTAAALIFSGVQPARVVLIGINTSLAAGFGCLTVVVLTRLRFRKSDASLTANGWITGLVAISASCSLATPLAAMLIGVVAGAVVVFAVEWVDRAGIDDPTGAIATHGLNGLLGVLAVGFVARADHGGVAGQWLAQLVGVATLLGFVLPLAIVLNWFLNIVMSQRVDSDGERHGLDMHELGADAYPEFVVASDDFAQR